MEKGLGSISSTTEEGGEERGLKEVANLVHEGKLTIKLSNNTQVCVFLYFVLKYLTTIAIQLLKLSGSLFK